MRVTQSQNVPLSCLSQPLGNRLAEAAYRDILGLSYVRAFSAEWNTADRGYTLLDFDFFFNTKLSKYYFILDQRAANEIALNTIKTEETRKVESNLGHVLNDFFAFKDSTISAT